MKLVCVFGSRFSSDLDAETLSKYLSDQLDCNDDCQCINNASHRYSSFKVCAECIDPVEMCNPEL